MGRFKKKLNGRKNILKYNIKKGLVNECPLKLPKISNYSFKKSTITISNAFHTQFFIKSLPFIVLKECLGGTR